MESTPADTGGASTKGAFLFLMGRGYVKLHRSLLDWEWYSDERVKAVFIHLLLRCNWLGGKWRGEAIEPGSIITSTVQMASELGMSRSALVRTLDKMKSSGEIDTKSDSRWTRITLRNWAKYQDDEPIPDSKPNNKRTATEQRTGQRADTIEEGKKAIKEEGKKSSPNGEAQAHGDQRINECVEHFKAIMGTPPDDSQRWQRIHCANLLKWMEATHPEPDAVTNVKALITAVVLDPFHGKNARSFKYLYTYRSPIVEAAKARKKSTKNLTKDEYGQAVADQAAKHLRDRANNGG